jgi:hypothetical protein
MLQVEQPKAHVHVHVHLPASRLRDCPVCYGPHDDDIHEATLSIRAWLKAEVTRYLPGTE